MHAYNDIVNYLGNVMLKICIIPRSWEVPNYTMYEDKL